MKRLFTLLLVSFVAMSCEMVDEKLDDLLGKKDVVVFAEGTELTANVPSKQTVLNYKFESTLDWEVTTADEWLEIDPMRGKAGKDIKIQIKVHKNKDEKSRTGYVDLVVANNDSYRITIKQAGTKDEQNDDVVVDIPHNQIWYTSTDGEVVEPYSGEYNEYAEAITTFGVNIVSNTYADGKGVIEFDGDVTTIGGNAFSGCSSLTSVTIPDSVTTIGDYAFSNCSSLASVTIPDSVTTIGNYAFYYCDSLTSVTIGDSVTIIGERAFSGCISLTSVTIGDSVTTIGGYAFGGCNKITEVNISDISAWCKIDFIDGDTSDTTNVTANPLYAGGSLYLNGEIVKDLVIPSDITEIKTMTFRGCSSLTSVTITDSVTTIGGWAFKDCSSLTSITIPDSVTTIGYGAFYWCDSLTSVIIPDSVTTIGYDAFYGCSSLTSVTIPDSVTEIGESAFAYCDSLTSVTIPDSVTTIGGSVFADCSSLTSVYCKPATPPAGDAYMFDDNASNRIIYVPTDSVEVYKSASYWNSYAYAIVGYDF